MALMAASVSGVYSFGGEDVSITAKIWAVDENIDIAQVQRFELLREGLLTGIVDCADVAGVDFVEQVLPGGQKLAHPSGEGGIGFGCARRLELKK